MVVSNVPGATEAKGKGKGKGKAKEILVDAASLEEMRNRDKNVQINAVVHPHLYHKIITTVAENPANVLTEDGKSTLRRTAYTNALRQAVASAFSYDGELFIQGRQGGNVIGVISAFNTAVGSMFEMARGMGAMTNMPEEQIKSFAFAKAKENVASHPALAGVEVSDEILEKLWSGAEVELDLDEDEDEEDEEDED